MIVRSKISYQALIERVTVLELFCTQVLNSYNIFVSQGHIIENEDSSKIYKAIVDNEPICIRRIIQLNLNLPEDDQAYIDSKIDKQIKTQLNRIRDKNTSNEIFRDYFVDI